ncbi:hypothetical protein LG311_10275 [Sutcliffiella horikoshii]|uniref:hypothetical protein n=1 Tax=Sutcliffiella horikoshii TaxID=79883 RepID=UPI00384E253E
MSFEFDGADFLKGLGAKELKTRAASELGMRDSTDDLAMISQNIAPIDKSTLRKNVDKRITWESPTRLAGEVGFSAVEKDGNGRFNYALWTHEQSYNLGEQSADSPGFKGYAVGNKYVERPLKGESQKYIGWIMKEIGKGLCI